MATAVTDKDNEVVTLWEDNAWVYMIFWGSWLNQKWLMSQKGMYWQQHWLMFHLLTQVTA
jgi:hypothetical protein